MEIKKSTTEKEALKIGKDCKQCGNCCMHGTGFLAKDDLKKIADYLKISENELRTKYLDEKELFNKKLLRPKLKSNEKPFGECIFFNNGCTIHDIKPLQCKIGNCGPNGEELTAWFLLNHIVDINDAESIRQYAVYLKSGGKLIAGGKLEEIVPNKIKLNKILKYEILR